MIKAIGVIMIIASCSAMGITLSRDMRLRLNGIKSHLTAFSIIKAEIIYKNTPLDKIIELLSEHCGGYTAMFYDETFKHAAVGMTFSSAAAKHYTVLKKQGLMPEDIDIIRQVCAVLGRYDGAQQVEKINISSGELERSLEALKAEIASKGKLYKAVGATVGIVLALMAI